MNYKKNLFQKISTVISFVCFVTAMICGVLLVLAGKNADDVYRSSLGACTFFFFAVGIVLNTIGSTNLPNLKVNNDNENEAIIKEENNT